MHLGVGAVNGKSGQMLHVYISREKETVGQIASVIQLINMLRLPVRGYLKCFKGSCVDPI